MQRYVCYICHSELGPSDDWEDGMTKCPQCGETNVAPRFSKSEIAIVLSCDFCGTDWDNESAMVEGHRGSILCLPCIEKARVEVEDQENDGLFKCTLCQQEKEGSTIQSWRHTSATVSPGLNAEAQMCEDCLQQAVRVMKKDKSVDWDGE